MTKYSMTEICLTASNYARTDYINKSCAQKLTLLLIFHVTIDELWPNFELGHFRLPLRRADSPGRKYHYTKRFCKYCTAGVVEDERHFLMQCELYNDLRCEMFHKASLHIPEFNLMNDNDKFLQILKNQSFQSNLAYFLYCMCTYFSATKF